MDSDGSIPDDDIGDIIEHENENIPAQVEFQPNPEINILDTIPEANETSQTLDEGKLFLFSIFMLKVSYHNEILDIKINKFQMLTMN